MRNTLITYRGPEVYSQRTVKTKNGARRSKIKQEREYGAYLSAVWFDANGNKLIIFG